MPSTRVFALIIGVDSYKSGNLWNLHACIEDAKKIRSWLTDELSVPKEQICMLQDGQATKANIETSFMHHLVNNPSIEFGDAILIYFAGHGSSIRPPSEWYQSDSISEMVEVICPYDHDTKTTLGRVSGISDRSFHAMMLDLATCKGDNITVILDCCFSPVQTAANILERSATRWSKTFRAESDDLYRDLWPTARGKSYNFTLGFSEKTSSCTVLQTCSRGQKSMETKSGGKFTSGLLRAMATLPLHRTTYVQLLERVQQMEEDTQNCVCTGRHRSRVLFNGIPFLTDNQFIPTSCHEQTGEIKIGVGTVHGVVEGTEFSLHLHNYSYSRNPSMAVVVAFDVHSLWCFARFKSRSCTLPDICFSQITKWNNRRLFRMHLKSPLTSFVQSWKLGKILPAKLDAAVSNKLHVTRVKSLESADFSLAVGTSCVSVTQHISIYPQLSTCISKIYTRNPVDVIDDAARFNMHLLLNNSDEPLCNLIDVKIWRLDPFSWLRIGGNCLKDGQAVLGQDSGAIYQLSLQNNSGIDLWPSVLYMDPAHLRVSVLYSSACSKEAPLLSKGSLDIGSGESGSEAFSFPIGDQPHVAFLKLFFSSAPVSMAILEQGSPTRRNNDIQEASSHFLLSTSCSKLNAPTTWDTLVIPLLHVDEQ